jgi:hypothetical protein
MNGISLDGEPRGSAKQRRIVNFAITIAQFQKLEDMAMMSNMNLSEYIRHALFGANGAASR